MEKWMEELHEQLPEEIEDAAKYMRLSRCAEADGYPSAAHYLLEIAYDEYTHADYIRDELTDLGEYKPEEHPDIERKFKIMSDSMR